VTAGFELALRVTLLALALDPPLLWFERLPVVLGAALGLALPAALRSPALWLALAALSAWPVAARWPFADNHEYLYIIWCLAVALALAARAPAALGAHYARRLVGLAFLFAAIWKLFLSPDFVDGRFFRLTLLSDARFETLAVLAGGMTFEEWAANDAAIDELVTEESPPESFRLIEPPALRRLAFALTLFTAAIEAAIAIAFLAPLRSPPARARDALLLLFVVATFSFATVQGFGWLLVSLGLAQCEGERPRTRAAYLAAFALVALYRGTPWTDALAALLG
jgi:hypothetical protein